MKLKMIATIVSTLVVANAYAAETYNIEAGVLNQTAKVDDQTEQKVMGVGGIYYLKPVTIDATKPFDELAFLQRASAITASYADVSLETSSLSKKSFGSTKIGGNFYIDNFTVGVSTSQWNKRFPFKSNAANSIGIDTKETAFKAGYLVTPNTEVSYVNEKVEADYTPGGGAGAVNSLSVKTNGVQSHTVMSLGASQWLVLDLSYKEIKTKQDNDDKNKLYSATVKYYPQANVYVEGGYANNTGTYEYDKGNTTTVGAGYAVTPRLALALQHLKFSGDVSAQNSSAKATTIKALYRF